MADVSTKTHRELVQLQAAAIQSKASGLLDFSVGAVLRAVVQAVGGVALWLQANILAVLAMTRLSTSQGDDVDSFVADLLGPTSDGGLPLIARFGATASKGFVTFTRLTAAGEAVVPLSASVETRDSKQRFAVSLDASIPAWRPDLAGYLMADGVATITLPAASLTVGAAANVQAGAIAVITSSIPGVDLVSNALAFTGGLDQEGSEAFKIRYRKAVRALREATPDALVGYVETLRAGVTATLVEYEDLDGTPRTAFSYLVVDDGSGDPPAELVDGASAAVRQHRAAGTQVAVYPPEVVSVAVAFGLDLQATGHEAADRAAAESAVRSYVDALAVGAPLLFNRLYGVIYAAADSIVEVLDLTVEGAALDVPALKYQVVKAGAVTIA